jgi:hypothetical protein
MCCYRLISLFWCFMTSLGYTAFVVMNAEQKHWLRIFLPHSHISDRNKNNVATIIGKKICARHNLFKTNTATGTNWFAFATAHEILQEVWWHLSPEEDRYQTTLVFHLNKFRVRLATKKEASLAKLPPCEATCHQHVLRASLQTYIWKSSQKAQSPVRSPLMFGWEDKGGRLE